MLKAIRNRKPRKPESIIGHRGGNLVIYLLPNEDFAPVNRSFDNRQLAEGILLIQQAAYNKRGNQPFIINSFVQLLFLFALFSS